MGAAAILHKVCIAKFKYTREFYTGANWTTGQMSGGPRVTQVKNNFNLGPFFLKARGVL